MDDEISEEVAELLGFDAIELVMEVISNRMPLSYKVRFIMPIETNIHFGIAL